MNFFVLKNNLLEDLYSELYEVEQSIQYHIYKTTSRTVESNPEYKSGIDTEMMIFTEKDGCFEIPVIDKICKRLPFCANTASFIKLKPGVVMPVHRDNPDLRASHLIIPISPLNENYKTTHFYDDDKTTVIEACDFSINPVIINTQQLHGVVNNEYTRIQFNLGFSENIRDWYEFFR